MARVLAQPKRNKDKPTFTWAMACSDEALKLYWEDGRDKRHIEQARDLFRGADQWTIFEVWYVMELCHRDTAAARACFEEWRSRGGGDADADFWCEYARFERVHGTRERARAVAEAALAARPRDREVFAMYARLELRMGCDRRACLVVERARDVLDRDALKWITNNVEQYRNGLRAAAAAARPTIGDLFCCLLSLFVGCLAW